MLADQHCSLSICNEQSDSQVMAPIRSYLTGKILRTTPTYILCSLQLRSLLVTVTSKACFRSNFVASMRADTKHGFDI